MKIVFVCLGNICRSPMAEFVMKDMLKRYGLDCKVDVISRATSYEEEGNDIYPPARRKLESVGIFPIRRRATRLTADEGAECDLIIAMEERNIYGIKKIVRTEDMGKVKRLLDFCDNPRDIADPWWTGNFDRTYDDIVEGCKGLITYLKEECSL